LNTRLNILPDPAFLDLKSALSERLERIAASIQPEQFASLLDPLMRQTVEHGFAEAGADEGTVWLMDQAGEFLVPAWNTGPNADQLVGKFRQPLKAGVICMVFSSEQPFLENDVWKNSRHSKLLDSTLKVQTSAMIAVPFYFLRGCRGVVSCVQLNKPTAEGLESADPGRDGFHPEHLAHVQRATATLSQLIELKLLGCTVGWIE
jgi:GAF domain-containing protein